MPLIVLVILTSFCSFLSFILIKLCLIQVNYIRVNDICTLFHHKHLKRNALDSDMAWWSMHTRVHAQIKISENAFFFMLNSLMACRKHILTVITLNTKTECDLSASTPIVSPRQKIRSRLRCLAFRCDRPSWVLPPSGNIPECG